MSRDPDLKAFLQSLTLRPDLKLCLPPKATMALRHCGFEPHDYGVLVMGEDDCTGAYIDCSSEPLANSGQGHAQSGTCSVCGEPAYYADFTAVPATIKLICSGCYADGIGETSLQKQ